MTVEILSWQQLVSRCGSVARARRQVRAGAWSRVLRDAYVAGAPPHSVEVRLAAVAAVVPAGSAVSHRAALWVLGCDVLDAHGRLDVTARRGLRLAARPGIRPHTAALPDDHLVQVAGLLVVSAARAFVDVARSSSLVEGVAFGDAVLRSGAATRGGLERCLVTAAGLRGVVRARQVLDHLEPRSESLMESRLRMKLVLGGLPRPEAQYDVYDDLGEHRGRGDLHLDGVLLEYDGRAERLEKARFHSDRRRRARLSELGFELREFTGRDVYGRTDADVCAEVRRALVVAAGRDRSRFRRGPDTLRPPRLSPLPSLADRRRAA